MSAKTLIFPMVLVGLISGGPIRADESDAPAPPPGGRIFDRIDLNHDGVIQREEFEQARALRGGARFERGDGERPRDRADGEDRLGKLIDGAVDRALAQSAGDPQELRKALREELRRSLGKLRGMRRGPNGAPPPPGPDGVDNENAPPDAPPPPDGPRGFGGRRGPRESGDGSFAPQGRFGRSRGGPGPARLDPEQRAERIMARLDANHDGVLTPDELGERGGRLMKADMNRDGKIDPQELRGFFQHMRDERDRRRPDRPDDGEPKPPPPGE